MSKPLITIILIVLSFSVFSQNGQVTTTTGTAESLYYKNGKVGIGTTEPNSILDIKLNSSGKGLQLIGENKNIDINIGHNGSTHGFYWRYKGVDSDNNNDLELWTNNMSGADKQVYNIHQDANIQFLQNVSIGNEPISGYKLAVNGTIKANEIKVEATGWSDFVFENDYKLKNLEEVESFIKENKHLPDVPSEKEVLENGIQLGEMNAKLLQKIEELTLYVIEQNKEIKELRELKQRMKLIEDRLTK